MMLALSAAETAAALEVDTTVETVLMLLLLALAIGLSLWHEARGWEWSDRKVRLVCTVSIIAGLLFFIYSVRIAHITPDYKGIALQLVKQGCTLSPEAQETDR
jgi:hypothetical protein